MNPAEAHERLMENQEFWEMFFPLFRDEAMVRKFAAISGLSKERIRRARFDYLHKKFAPHLHEGNGTIN
jgi:hypothetical protein